MTEATYSPKTVSEWATLVVGVHWPDARIDNVRPLQGGASSLTFSATVVSGEIPADKVVVKLAPPGIEPRGNRDVLRQARILTAIAEASPKFISVPLVLAADPGDHPNRPPVLIMSFVRGDSFEPTNGSGSLPPPGTVRERSLQAARMLADLHSIDTDSAALQTDRPQTLTEEVARWAAAFQTVGHDLAPSDAVRCCRSLLEEVPDSLKPCIVHGDWRLGNMLCQGARIKAVIDWEIWSIGDPRIDLAWFALMADDRRFLGLRKGTGLPSPKRLIDEYERALGITLESYRGSPRWRAYKQAAVSALLVKYARKSRSADERVLSFSENIAPLLNGALRCLSEQGRSRR